MFEFAEGKPRTASGRGNRKIGFPLGYLWEGVPGPRDPPKVDTCGRNSFRLSIFQNPPKVSNGYTVILKFNCITAQIFTNI
jgi:hypothetical protein